MTGNQDDSAPAAIVPATEQLPRLAAKDPPAAPHPIRHLHLQARSEAAEHAPAILVRVALPTPPWTGRLRDLLDDLFYFRLALEVQTRVIHRQIGLSHDAHERAV